MFLRRRRIRRRRGFCRNEQSLLYGNIVRFQEEEHCFTATCGSVVKGNQKEVQRSIEGRISIQHGRSFIPFVPYHLQSLQTGARSGGFGYGTMNLYRVDIHNTRSSKKPSFQSTPAWCVRMVDDEMSLRHRARNSKRTAKGKLGRQIRSQE